MKNNDKTKFRIKGIFTTRTGKEFVRYWRNSRGVTGWLFPELVAMADTFTAKEAVKVMEARKANAAGRYSYEPVAAYMRPHGGSVTKVYRSYADYCD